MSVSIQHKSQFMFSFSSVLLFFGPNVGVTSAEQSSASMYQFTSHVEGLGMWSPACRCTLSFSCVSSVSAWPKMELYASAFMNVECEVHLICVCCLCVTPRSTWAPGAERGSFCYILYAVSSLHRNSCHFALCMFTMGICCCWEITATVMKDQL